MNQPTVDKKVGWFFELCHLVAHWLLKVETSGDKRVVGRYMTGVYMANSFQKKFTSIKQLHAFKNHDKLLNVVATKTATEQK